MCRCADKRWLQPSSPRLRIGFVTLELLRDAGGAITLHIVRDKVVKRLIVQTTDRLS